MPEPPPESWFPQWVHDLGSLSSILSLIATIVVAWKISTITKHYRELALVPQLKTKTSTHLKNLEKTMKSKDWLAFQKEAAVVTATIENAEMYIQGTAKPLAMKTIASARIITRSQSQDFLHAEANELVVLLTEIDATLQLSIESKKWQIMT